MLFRVTCMKEIINCWVLQYYIQGKTGRKLRSMKRVRHFMQTGRATIRKPRKKAGEGNSRVSDDKVKSKF